MKTCYNNGYTQRLPTHQEGQRAKGDAHSLNVSSKPNTIILAILARHFRFRNYALPRAVVSCQPTNGTRCMGDFVSTPHTPLVLQQTSAS